MATTSKLSFRARNLDANKPMAVYFADELPDLSECAPINRAVAQMPTGMEKDEEMESHLQDAIMAQQASTSGIAVENHVIPTPKVFPVPAERYDVIYPPQPNPDKNLIKVQAWLTMDQEEPEYDMDSEDEQWLKERPHIQPRDLEKIFETLEAECSETQICLPSVARSKLSLFEETVVDDVYDYWLNKRKEVTTSRGIGCGGLIPKVRTEAKKDGSVNPYVAFRRRAEKMQTRKNRKNDEDSYEKVLKVGHDLRRTVTLFDLVKKREKTKLVLLDAEFDILKCRMESEDFDSSLYNQIQNSVSECSVNYNGPLKEENGVVKKKTKKPKKAPTRTAADREIPSKAWLKKNAEVWNMPPSLSGVFSGVSPIVEVDKSFRVQADDADGPYTFKRRKHCVYRAARVPSLEPEIEDPLMDVPPERRFYRTYLPIFNGGIQSIGYARRRIGRGGRVIFDRLVDAVRVPPNGSRVLDPFEQNIVMDHKPSFRARFAPYSDEEGGRSSSRFFSNRRQSGDSDCERELEWLSSARSPTPEECPMEDDRPEIDEGIVVSRDGTPPLSVYSVKNNGSGNGPAGRVGHPAQCNTVGNNHTSNQSQVLASSEYPVAVVRSMASVIPSVPMEVIVSSENGQVSDDSSWHENSRSPSESNSSADWPPPQKRYRDIAHYAILSSEEETAARIGDHPKKPAKPSTHNSIKAVVGTTVVGSMMSRLAPAPSVG